VVRTDLATAQNGIAQMVMDQYENHCKCYRAAAQYEKTSADIEAIRKELVRANLQRPGRTTALRADQARSC